MRSGSEQIASEVTHTICEDATNREAVKQLGIGNYDGAIIGVGRSLETSALITMQLKELNVPFIMAKACHPYGRKNFEPYRGRQSNFS